MYDEGYVSCMKMKDYKYIYKNLQQRPPKQLIACLRPEEVHIHDIAEQYPWLRFSDIIRCFKDRCQVNENEFFIPDYEKMLQIAQIMENIPLSVKDKYIFTTIPLRSNSIESLGFVQEWAINLARDKLVYLHLDEKQLVEIMEKLQMSLRAVYLELNQSNNGKINGAPPRMMENNSNNTSLDINMNVNDINDVELLYSILSCYRFLAFRFPTFVDYQKCQHLLHVAAKMIQQGFDDVTIQNKYHYQQQQHALNS
mmetsp:Transcript_58537/g.93054  ORF Transcript_58537/g.93054 Transcript_58537/m.93054 type:complete len:254 (+) Transcript_58537:1-762(+)